MAVVMLYGFTGSFAGQSEIDWRHPAVGEPHKCLLFLRQAEESENFLAAQAELSRFGFGTVEFARCGRLQVEVLNTDTFRGFVSFYQEALEEGSCIVWYPNEAA